MTRNIIFLRHVMRKTFMRYIFHTKGKFSFWPWHISIFVIMCTNSNLSHLSNVLITISSRCKKYWEIKSKGNNKNVSLIQNDRICSQYFLVSKNIWWFPTCLDEYFRFWLFVLKVISRKLIRLQTFSEENLSSRKNVLRNFLTTSHRLDIYRAFY